MTTSAPSPWVSSSSLATTSVFGDVIHRVGAHLAGNLQARGHHTHQGDLAGTGYVGYPAANRAMGPSPKMTTDLAVTGSMSVAWTAPPKRLRTAPISGGCPGPVARANFRVPLHTGQSCRPPRCRRFSSSGRYAANPACTPGIHRTRYGCRRQHNRRLCSASTALPTSTISPENSCPIVSGGLILLWANASQ